MKSIYVLFFLISRKVRPKRVEHLHDEGIIPSELYFKTSCIFMRLLVFQLASPIIRGNSYIMVALGPIFSIIFDSLTQNT